MPKKIFIGGLSVTSSESSVNTAFARFGTIRSLSLSPDRGASTQSANLDYADSDSGTEAIAAMDGATLDGNVIEVSSRP